MSEKSRGPDSGVLELERYEPGTAVVTYHGVKFGCIEEKNPNKSGLNMQLFGGGGLHVKKDFWWSVQGSYDKYWRPASPHGPK